MEVKATLRQLRMSPRKVRLVAGLIRGKNIAYSLGQLQFANKAAAKPVAKLVKSAVANAVNNFGLEESNLFVKEISVDGGPSLKRWTPRAQGRATPIMKRTSHVNITIGEIKDSGIKEGKKVAVAAPVKLSAEPKSDEGIKVADADDNQKLEARGTNEPAVHEHDPRNEGRVGHVKQEGGGTAGKGFAKKVFNRKSG